MDALGRLSVTDFLVFFFPGVAGCVGIYVGLIAFSFVPLPASLDLGVAAGVAALGVAYVVGVILSGLSESLSRLYTRGAPAADPRLLASSPAYRDRALHALRQIAPLGVTSGGEWTLEDFHLCNALVREGLPTASREIQRENAVTRMRESLLAVVLIWTAAGVAWGARWSLADNLSGGIGLAAASVGGGIVLTASLRSLLDHNRRREARLTVTSFLMGCSTGAFRVGTPVAPADAPFTLPGGPR